MAKPESGASRCRWQYSDPDPHLKQTAFKQIAKRTTRKGSKRDNFDENKTFARLLVKNMDLSQGLQNYRLAYGFSFFVTYSSGFDCSFEQSRNDAQEPLTSTSSFLRLHGYDKDSN
jgi:hypothetical protein